MSVPSGLTFGSSRRACKSGRPSVSVLGEPAGSAEVAVTAFAVCTLVEEAAGGKVTVLGEEPCCAEEAGVEAVVACPAPRGLARGSRAACGKELR